MQSFGLLAHTLRLLPLRIAEVSSMKCYVAAAAAIPLLLPSEDGIPRLCAARRRHPCREGTAILWMAA